MQETRTCPGEGNGNPLQYSCLENPMNRGVWQVQSMGHKELDGTEWLTHIHTFFCGHSSFLPLTLNLLPSLPTFPVSLFSHSLSHRSYLLHFGCSCLQAGSVWEDLGVVMEKHMQLDEHLSGSSVFVFLCVGISVRGWIFAWICKLGVILHFGGCVLSNENV